LLIALLYDIRVFIVTSQKADDNDIFAYSISFNELPSSIGYEGPEFLEFVQNRDKTKIVLMSHQQGYPFLPVDSTNVNHYLHLAPIEIIVKPLKTLNPTHPVHSVETIKKPDNSEIECPPKSNIRTLAIPQYPTQTIKKLDNSKIETKLMGIRAFYFKVDDGQRYTFLSDHMAAKKMEEMEIGKDKLRRIPLHEIYTRLIDISSKIVMFSPTEETNLESTAHAIPNHVPVYIVDKKGPTAGSWSCLRIFFTKQDRDAGWDALTFENKRRARRRETTFFELLEDMRGEDAHSKVSYDEKTQFVKPFYQKDSY
jgi:hypothetical protein